MNRSAISLLSLGAVVSLQGGFYYWIGKITGYHYSEKWAQIQQIIFTLAVNLVFLPMHWLGLNGLPRRIPDYPDGYIGWNHIISQGSILTFISLIIFQYVVAVTVFNPCTTKINNQLTTRWVGSTLLIDELRNLDAYYSYVGEIISLRYKPYIFIF